MESDEKKGLTGGWLAFFKIWSMATIPTIMAVLAILSLITLRLQGIFLFLVCSGFGWWSFKISKHNFYCLGVEHLTAKHVQIGLAFSFLMGIVWAGLQTWWVPIIRNSPSADKHWEVPIIFFAMLPFVLQMFAYQKGQNSRSEE